jgi:hypothetical protein
MSLLAPFGKGCLGSEYLGSSDTSNKASVEASSHGGRAGSGSGERMDGSASIFWMRCRSRSS